MDDGPVMESIRQCSHLSPGDSRVEHIISIGSRGFPL